MSGLAAGIRLAMFDQKVLVLEKHSLPGGLNSFYRRKGRNLDVGLHALTNFMKKGEKAKPLGKILKQLRIPYDSLQLMEQKRSVVHFPNHRLAFSNDLELFKAEIAREFPDQVQGFSELLEMLEAYNEVDLEAKAEMAKEVVAKYITNEELLEMIFCPLMVYGSAWEDDMDFAQFAIMFQSIFMEGFSRPRGGVRTLISLLMDKLKASGCEIRFNQGVKQINAPEGKLQSVVLASGETLSANRVFSSAGHRETLNLCSPQVNHFEQSSPVGRLSFVECIFHFSCKPSDLGLHETIIFYNNHAKYVYKRPEELIDARSAVVCMPNNFSEDDQEEGVVRVTFMANYDKWKELGKEEYKEAKERVAQAALALIFEISAQEQKFPVFSDVFTPLTVERYTGHLQGSIYGSPKKLRKGETFVENIFLCGTDQGFLGISGSLLSGISMANLHGLK
ncbi:MAG: NAD(P)/FAD-dependent oxidoreductase [Planctomycetes bacterium]|nr:NAD(P)/FAD-dependent oxidoreductase [Planctomycetota bacterium]